MTLKKDLIGMSSGRVSQRSGPIDVLLLTLDSEEGKTRLEGEIVCIYFYVNKDHHNFIGGVYDEEKNN